MKVHRLRLPGRSLCSIRSDRKWCKRRGSSLQCQNCFFVYPIIDCNLKNLDGNELKNAIIETFSHRGTGFDDIVVFEPTFTQDSVRQGRWKSFIKKKKAILKVEFQEVIDQITKLLLPIVDAIGQKKEFNYQWDKERNDWI